MHDRGSAPFGVPYDFGVEGRSVWYAASGPSGAVEWKALTEPVTERPSDEALVKAVAGLPDGVGRVRLENDTHVWVVLTCDEAAHEIVSRRLRDGAALAQEWMVPPHFSFVIADDDAQLHIALTDDLSVTLCGLKVARPTIVEGMATCGACARLTG